MRLTRFFATLLFAPILLVACDTLGPEPTTSPADGAPEAVLDAVTPAVTPQAADSFSQVSAGSYHNCGLKQDGSVACWGNNYYGESNAPTGSFIAVYGSFDHTCGRKQDGSVTCWGYNLFGQASPPTGSFSQVGPGLFHTCGVKQDGNVACWGNNSYGQSSTPTGSFSQVSAGGNHTCGLKQDGSVACWGKNDYGQTNAPTGSFSQLEAGLNHTCGVKQDSSIACWGYNNFGQSNAPTGNFSQVSAGYYDTCGLKQDGSVACWGYNLWGQSSPPTGSFSQVSVGYRHTCGVRQDGRVACWGANAFGESTSPTGPDDTTGPTVTVNQAQGQDDPASTGPVNFTVVFDEDVTGFDADDVTLSGTAGASTKVVTAGPATYNVAVSGMTQDGTVIAEVRAGAVQDAVGNLSSASTSTDNIVTYAAPIVDSTPPSISPTVTGTLGNNDWYTGNVSVTWTVTDAESDISNQIGCNSTTVSSDTSGVTLTCEATSAGGTSSESVTLKRDATAPTLAPTVSPDPVLLNGTATATPNASDALSGVASKSCDAVLTDGVGSKSVPCTATDDAGNSASASAGYEVLYGFSGFSQPVDNTSPNKAKAGQAIPLKWRLTDADGTPVTTLAGVQLSVASLSCSSGLTPDAVEEYASGDSGLQNLGDGLYQYNWKTPTTYAGSCKTLQLDLGDGLDRTAAFEFTK